MLREAHGDHRSKARPSKNIRAKRAKVHTGILPYIKCLVIQREDDKRPKTRTGTACRRSMIRNAPITPVL